ncbi:Hypothetical protein EIN_223230, partial [Entamoeba invadens IP1]
EDKTCGFTMDEMSERKRGFSLDKDNYWVNTSEQAQVRDLTQVNLYNLVLKVCLTQNMIRLPISLKALESKHNRLENLSQLVNLKELVYNRLPPSLPSLEKLTLEGVEEKRGALEMPRLKVLFMKKCFLHGDCLEMDLTRCDSLLQIYFGGCVIKKVLFPPSVKALQFNNENNAPLKLKTLPKMPNIGQLKLKLFTTKNVTKCRSPMTLDMSMMARLDVAPGCVTNEFQFKEKMATLKNKNGTTPKDKEMLEERVMGNYNTSAANVNNTLSNTIQPSQLLPLSQSLPQVQTTTTQPLRLWEFEKNEQQRTVLSRLEDLKAQFTTFQKNIDRYRNMIILYKRKIEDEMKTCPKGYVGQSIKNYEAEISRCEAEIKTETKKQDKVKTYIVMKQFELDNYLAQERRVHYDRAHYQPPSLVPRSRRSRVTTNPNVSIQLNRHSTSFKQPPTVPLQNRVDRTNSIISREYYESNHTHVDTITVQSSDSSRTISEQRDTPRSIPKISLLISTPRGVQKSQQQTHKFSAESTLIQMDQSLRKIDPQQNLDEGTQRKEDEAVTIQMKVDEFKNGEEYKKGMEELLKSNVDDWVPEIEVKDIALIPREKEYRFLKCVDDVVDVCI